MDKLQISTNYGLIDYLEWCKRVKRTRQQQVMNCKSSCISGILSLHNQQVLCPPPHTHNVPIPYIKKHSQFYLLKFVTFFLRLNFQSVVISKETIVYDCSADLIWAYIADVFVTNTGSLIWGMLIHVLYICRQIINISPVSWPAHVAFQLWTAVPLIIIMPWWSTGGQDGSG